MAAVTLVLYQLGFNAGRSIATKLSQQQIQGLQTFERAVIFDMDGVITDSESLYSKALDVALSQEGHTLTTDDHRIVTQRSAAFTWRYVIDRLNLTGDIDSWIA